MYFSIGTVSRLALKLPKIQSSSYIEHDTTTISANLHKLEPTYSYSSRFCFYIYSCISVPLKYQIKLNQIKVFSIFYNMNKKNPVYTHMSQFRFDSVFRFFPIYLKIMQIICVQQMSFPDASETRSAKLSLWAISSVNLEKKTRIVSRKQREISHTHEESYCCFLLGNFNNPYQLL